MKQLIEEQRKDFDIWFKEYPGVPTIGEIQEWYEDRFKQFIDGLVEEANVRVATLEELKAKFNLEIDEHRIDEVGRYISYLKKLKEELN